MNGLINRRNRSAFTEILTELVCTKKCGLQTSLYFMSCNKGIKNKAVTFASREIYDSLLNGFAFSSALKLCSLIEFDTLYISFINFAERSGNLENTLLFLKRKCIREQDNFFKIIEATVYPVFVIVLAVLCGCFLFSYSSMSNQNFYSCFGLAFSFLSSFCFISFYVLYKLLGTNRLYEAFLATGFLVKGGESLANAVRNAVNVLGYETKEGQLFAKAGENLSYGMSLHNSFAGSNSFLSSSLRSELEEAFFYAENSGGETDVFEKIALWLNSRDEKRRTICLKLIEPVFILGTGIFLLIFLVNLVLPLITESAFIL